MWGCSLLQEGVRNCRRTRADQRSYPVQGALPRPHSILRSLPSPAAMPKHRGPAQATVGALELTKEGGLARK